MMAFAFACWISALFIPRTGEGAPGLKINPNIAASTINLIKYVRGDRRIERCVLDRVGMGELRHRNFAGGGVATLGVAVKFLG